MIDMLTPWNIQCDGYAMRQVISHDRLKNELLLFGITSLGDWACSDEKERFEHEVRELIEIAVEGFSPKSLVDQIPQLAIQGQGFRGRVKEAVHRAYLATTVIARIRDELDDSARSLLRSLSDLQKAWTERAGDDEPQIVAKYEQVRSDSRRLREVVEKLPRGVVFP